MAETKICKKCGRELPVTEFFAHKSTKDGLQPVCKECQKEQVRQSRARIKALREKVTEPAGDTPASKKATGLEGVDEGLMLAELKRRGYFWTDLYKYVKVDFETIK